MGKKVEKEYDPRLVKYFDGLRGNYLLEIIAPGTRTKADFRVQINVYEVVKREKGIVTLHDRGHVKVSHQKLKSLDVPEFFAKMGEETQEYIQRLEKRLVDNTQPK